LNFSELQKQPGGRKGFYSGCSDRTRIDAWATAKSAGLTENCDDIKVEEVGYYAGNDETFVSDDASRRDEAVPDNSDSLFYFIL